jgi:two-component system sensor kinase FixL
VEIRVVKSSDEEAVCIFRDITERKQAERKLVESLDRLNRTQRQLIDASHRAGMAEVASSVLHNVGNVLNSVNVSANAAREILAVSRITGMSKAVRMMRDHLADLGPFLNEDPKGQRVLPYLEQLSEALDEERNRVRGELEHLQSNIDHIRVIVSTQQTHARANVGVIERFSPSDVVEDALKLTGAGGANGFELVRSYAPVGEIQADRHKVLQIVTNLLSNARHAIASAPAKTLTVRIDGQADSRVVIAVEDSGCGIAAENLKKIFQYGFTTRKDGHGFGLHSSANAAREMGGSLTAYSEGSGLGAKFILELPLKTGRPSVE